MSFLKLKLMTVDELEAARIAIEAEMAERRGEPLVIEHGGRAERNVPPGGFLVYEEWAVGDMSQTLWFGAIASARAHVFMLARREGAAWRDDGRLVSADLTSPGCHTSRVWMAPNPTGASGGAACTT